MRFVSSDSSLNPTPDSNAPEPIFKRWLMFLFRPADALELLHIISNPTSKFAAASLPPDVTPVATFWDEERGFMGLMLESEYFEEIPVFERDGQMMGDYPRAILSFAQEAKGPKAGEDLWGDPNEDDVVDELQRQAGMSLFEGLQSAGTRDFHVRGFNFSATDLLTILRAKSVRQLPVFPVYPREARVLGVIVHDKIKTWSIFLEHTDFPAAKLTEVKSEEMVYVAFESDGHDLELRIGLPGAKITRKITLDADELES